MEIVRFGRSGVKVSRVCLGTMTFGRETDEAGSFRVMDRYLELGGNYLDTANNYADSKSELIIGRWLKERGKRQQVFLATKVFAKLGPGPNDGGLSRLHIMRAVEDSLRRLQTDVIDLYQLHHWDPDSPMEETLAAMNDLVRQGKVRYFGCSNLRAWQLARFLSTSDRHLWDRFVSLQSIYNAVNRGIETELLPLCEVEGLAVVTFNPLAGGVLTGKYRRGEPLQEGTRLQFSQMYVDRYYTEDVLDLAERFATAARERGVTPAQLALAWVLGENRVTCPILGARTVEQFEDSIRGAEIKLDPAERSSLPAVQSGHWLGSDPVFDTTVPHSQPNKG